MIRRTRGRGGNGPHNGGGNGGGHRPRNSGGSGGGSNNSAHNTLANGGVPNRHQVYDSNGPDVRIRGNAYQVFDKYQAMARDAHSMGDRVKAENYLQHAEHYYRIILAIAEATGEMYRAQPGGNAEGGEATMVTPQDPSQMPQPSAPGTGEQPDSQSAVA
jgi:hypothetical protein